MERPRQKEVSDWYIETAKKSHLFDYGPVKGTIVMRPYGYAIWEEIQRSLDPMIRSLGCENAYFPLFIPESFLAKEKEHIKGFSPEFAVVTHAGGKKLEEPLIVRPTSETIMYSLFAKWITSWRDLPLRINQWANVVRWEMRPFPFIRTSEFLWHEAHTAHASQKEAEGQVMLAMEMYRRFFEEVLAIPVILGKKTEREKFAGALHSNSCEALLMDGKALQIATAHHLGQNFSRPFKIAFQNNKGKEEYVWQTSWGVSTRAVGGLILTHGDRKGLIFPPRIAPIQIIIVPIHKGTREGTEVLAKCSEIREHLKSLDIRIEIDAREQFTPGWKFNEWELKGVPLRIELGPKDLEKNSALIVRRDSGEKKAIVLSDLREKIPMLLGKVQNDLFHRARDFVSHNTHEVDSFGEFTEVLEKKRGSIIASWCGDSECEKLIKEKTKATTRCIPFDSKPARKKCVHCGRAGKFVPYWARAY